jgi:SAM-dependent methyltransferase
MNLRKRAYEAYISLYDHVKQESQLLWYREEIPLYLKKAVELLNGKGKALDIGCGTGVFSVYMAQAGLQVTALDFVPKAIELAKTRANQFGVKINFVQADIVEWETSDKYDLIFDSGCLHSISPKWGDRIRYRKQVLKWMSAGGIYVLAHFARESWFNFNIIGPFRKTLKEIELFFSPEFKLIEHYTEKRNTGTFIHYWFELKR